MLVRCFQNDCVHKIMLMIPVFPECCASADVVLEKCIVKMVFDGSIVSDLYVQLFF